MELTGIGDVRRWGHLAWYCVNAMDTFDRDWILIHGFLLKQKKGSLGVTRLPGWGWIDPLLALAVAPAIIELVAEPDAAVLLPAFHLALVDRAPVG